LIESQLFSAKDILGLFCSQWHHFLSIGRSIFFTATSGKQTSGSELPELLVHHGDLHLHILDLIPNIGKLLLRRSRQ
jgi:hypothetical protein